MSAASQFGGGVRLGSVVQGFGLMSPEYERLDGRTMTIASNTRLAEKFPIRKLTGTIRTLLATPTSPQIVATANHFVAAAASGASAVQYSADGASWVASTATPTMSVAVLVATPTRIIAYSSGANLAIASSNLTPAATWATVGGPQSITVVGSSMCRACYHAAGSRVVVVHQTSGVSTLDEGSTSSVARTSSARQGVCSTGARLIGITAGSATISVSVDHAVTWADATLPEALSASQGNIASNGSGTVVVSGSPSGLQVSFDHGVSWQIAQIPGVPPSDIWRVQYSAGSGGSAGYFTISTVKGLAMSLDARDWQIDQTPVQGFVATCGVARKGSTIVQIPASGGTTAYSFSESTTEYLLPNIAAFTPSISGVPTPLAQLFIKAL